MLTTTRNGLFFGTATLSGLLSVYLLFLSSKQSYNKQTDIDMAQLKYIHLRFEVTGKVQGVFFRKCTKNEADRLGLVGWVQNTKRGTVIGEAEGDRKQIEAMKEWLKYGSSKIPPGQKGYKIHVEEAEFQEHNIEQSEFQSFVVDRKNKYKDFTLFKK